MTEPARLQVDLFLREVGDPGGGRVGKADIGKFFGRLLPEWPIWDTMRMSTYYVE